MVEKLLPALVAFVIEMDVDDRVVFGFDGFLNEFHVCLCGRPTAFFDIAFQAGAHDIIPCCATAQAAGNHVIQR